MSADIFGGFLGRAVSVTPSDATNLAAIPHGIYVGASGDVAVEMLDGSTVTFVGLAAGVVHPIRVKRVNSTNTTATDILALYSD